MMEEQDKATSQLLFEVAEMNDRNENNKTKKLDSWNVQPMKNTEVRFKENNKRNRLRFCNFCIYFIYGILMFLFGVFVTIIVLHFWNPSISSDILKIISSPLSIDKIYNENNELKNFKIIENSYKEEYIKCCPKFQHKSLRLLESIEPISYNIKVYPNLKTLKLHGNVTININVIDDEDIIVLHADRLNMIKHKIKVNGEKVKALFKECICQEQWLFEFSNQLKIGDYVEIYIEYLGTIHTDMNGLYMNEHHGKNGIITKSVVTQFEPAMARRFMPCFDEPSFKAIFNLSIIREPHHISRSNMPIYYSEEYEYNNELMIDYFLPTVKMSTYILALGVFDDFKKIRRISKNTMKPIEINLLATSQIINNQTDFGMTTSIMALEFFEKYFNIAFPLPKIDLIGLDTFLESAMENFGMITFRDSSLLFNENNSTSRAKQHIANVISHEMAHQYFGNLVTFKWWNDLWLSEGFATLMEYYCISNLYPSWKSMEAFYVDNYITSMNVDGMLSSHPISTKVENPSDISSIFDAISYSKGAAIIQMIKGISGDSAFQKALREYLETYSYKNAEGQDLWNIIQKHVEVSSDITINDLAEAWTLKMGYPIVGMKWEDRIHENDYKWPIPIHYITDTIKDSRLIWFKENDENLRLDLGKHSKWFLANTDSKGYFRVLYDNDNYKALVKQLKINHRKIKTIDRSIIINDAFTFVKSGHLNISEALNLIEYLAKGVEKDRSPWYVTNQHLLYIDNILKDSSIYEDYQDFKRHLILNSYEKLEWNKPIHITDKLFQSEIFGIACKCEINHCLKQAKLLFKKWTRNKDLIPIDLQKIIIEEGIRQGGKQEWELVFKEYQTATNPSQKDLYLTALTQTREIKLINRLLNFCLDPSIIRPNIISKVISHLMNNQVASVHVWRFFKINIKKFKDISPSIYRLIRSLVSKFSTKYEYNSLVALFEEDKNLKLTMKNLYYIIFFFKIIICNDSENRLFENLFSSYSKLIRPIKNANNTIDILFKMKLNQIIDVNEREQIIKVFGWLYHQWHDYRLEWNPSEYGGTEMLHIPGELIWLPDIILYNNAGGTPWVRTITKVDLYYNGTIIWEPPFIYDSVCSINTKWFPYDEQTCGFKFGSWSYSSLEVDIFHPEKQKMVLGYEDFKTIWYIENAIDIDEFQESVEWDVVEIRGLKHKVKYPCCEKYWIDITYYINIRRKKLFYTINLMIPCIVLASASSFVFYIPCESNLKIQYCISIFVALTIFYLLLIEIIPPTSTFISLIGKYLLFTMFMVAYSIFFTVIVQNIHYRREQMPSFIREIFINILGKRILIFRDSEEIKFHKKERYNKKLPSLSALRMLERHFKKASNIKTKYEEEKKRITKSVNIQKKESLNNNSDYEKIDTSQLDKRLTKVGNNIQYIAKCLQHLRKIEEIGEDWRFVAMVIDRILLAVFFITILIGTLIACFSAPSLRDYRKPLNNPYLSMYTKYQQ
uniref:Uncharacterized protein n=1 Tax=Strongyloides stercoralis TaxID=6248 RepID=A0AAF5DI52_STRER